MSEELQSSFRSPLRISVRTEFNAIRFGRVELDNAVAGLRQQLNQILFRVAADLPEPLAAEACVVLRNYPGGDGDFYKLFYVPIWSFLHWVPAAVSEPTAGDELLLTANTAHAMSLFLHLWDDHLCDQQLPVDLLRLQLRTVAWERYQTAAAQLCRKAGGDPLLPEKHASEYLSSLHHPEPVSDLNGYCRRFIRQVAIWTLVPRLLGEVAGAGAASELSRIIESFAIAWRLLDDIQDIHLDLMKDERTAVWIELDDEGRRKWDDCRVRSVASGELDAETWASLAEAVHVSGCLTKLLSRIDEELQGAAQIAGSNGWAGIAAELEQTRQITGRRTLSADYADYRDCRDQKAE